MNARKADLAYRVDEKGLLAWGGGDLLDQGKVAEAVEVYKLAVAMYPNSASGYSSLGAAYQKAGQKSLAVQNFRRALELDPQDYFAMDQLSALR